MGVGGGDRGLRRRRAPPARDGRLPCFCPRSPDRLPQSHRQGGALRGGDREPARDRAMSADRVPYVIRRLTNPTDEQIQNLVMVLIDCVEGGASVSFMHPLSPAKALAFWRRVAAD